MLSDAQRQDCPPCKAVHAHPCQHTEAERQKFRELRAQRNREKKRRQKANARADRRRAFQVGDKWC